MKTRLLTTAALLLFSVCVHGQIMVNVRPVAPVVVIAKPFCPGLKYIWINGHWVWINKFQHYVWIDGYWMKAKKGKSHAPGHWVGAGGRWKWIPGHMKK